MSSATSEFDAAMSALTSLHTSTTSIKETYFLGTGADHDGAVIDEYRYPAHHSRDSFITPGYVSLRTNVFSVSWLIVLFKILAELDLGPSDTLVELDCGDGRWLIEAAKKTGCNCIGYGKSDELEYRCHKMAAEQDINDVVDYVVVSDFLEEGDLSEATAVIVHAMQENMSLLRDKLEEEVNPYTPIIVVGGEIVGWLHQWTTKHQGVPVYIYSRRTDGILGKNDNLQQPPRDQPQLDRADGSLPGTGVDRGTYESNYKSFVHTPHEASRK